jgi:hypothetical protein
MFNQPFMNNPQDHIMANTWRLIFEHKSRPAVLETHIQPVAADFAVLEQLLPEYRLIGLCLADNQPQRRYN